MSDVRQVAELLAATYDGNNDRRRAAEQALTGMQATQGFYAALLQLTTVPECSPAVRLAAALMLKNAARRCWSVTKPARAGQGPSVFIHAQDRAVMRANLVGAVVIQADRRVRKALLVCIEDMLITDFTPENWPELVPHVESHLAAPEPARVYGGLLVLMAVFKRLKHGLREKKAAREAFFERFQPFMLQALASLANERAGDGVEMRRVMIKSASLATTLDLPPSWVQNFAAIGPWVRVLLHELADPMTPELQRLGEAEGWGRRKEKAQLYAYKLLSRLFTRFGRPAFSSDGLRPWAVAYESQVAPAVLATTVRHLEVQRASRCLNGTLLHLMYNFVDAAVNQGKLFPLLKPHMGTILVGCVVPSIGLRAEDLQLIRENPDEYLRRTHTEAGEFTDPRITATNVLVSMMKNRAGVARPAVLGHIERVFTEYAAAQQGARDLLAKEACMRTFGCLRSFMLGTPEDQAAAEGILIAHVMPEMGNAEPFMRASALNTLQMYWNLQWSSGERYTAYAEAVAKSLEDPAPIVRVQAALAVARLVRRPEVVQFLRPMLGTVLQHYVSMLGSNNCEVVLNNLTELVACVGPEIAPMAGGLVQQLIVTFNRLVAIEDPDEADEASMSAITAAYTIRTLIKSCRGVPQAQAGLVAQLVPWMTQLLASAEAHEYHDTACEVTGELVRHCGGEPPAQLWSMLPRIVALYFGPSEDSCDMVRVVFGAVEEFIALKSDVLLHNKTPNVFELLLKWCAAVLANSERRLSDTQYAFKTYRALMAHYHGRVDAAMPTIVLSTAALVAAQQKLEEEDKASEDAVYVIVAGINVLSQACYYNAPLTLQLLGSGQAGPGVSVGYILNMMLSYGEMLSEPVSRRLMSLGLTSLLVAQPLPDGLEGNMSTLADELVRFITMWLRDGEEKNEYFHNVAHDEEEEEYDGEDDEAAYTFEDVGDDADGNDDEDDPAELAALYERMNDEFIFDGSSPAIMPSPLDDVRTLGYFVQCLQARSQRHAQWYQQWSAALSAEAREALQLIMHEAEKESLEAAKQEQQKQAAAAAAAAAAHR